MSNSRAGRPMSPNKHSVGANTGMLACNASIASGFKYSKWMSL